MTDSESTRDGKDSSKRLDRTIGKVGPRESSKTRKQEAARSNDIKQEAIAQAGTIDHKERATGSDTQLYGKLLTSRV